MMLLLEKVNKREIDEALSNPNVRLGAEFEFLIPAFNSKYGHAAKMWVSWDNYQQRLDAWESSTEEYEGAGEEEGYDPPDVPEWAKELGYEAGEEDLPNPTELFDLPELDVESFFTLVMDEFVPVDKMPFKNPIIDTDNMRKSTTQWIIKPDATLGPSGIEVVSPILTIDEFLDMCPKMFDYIEKYGETNDSCGFHISISLKNVTNLSDSLDVVKLALFLEEDYIYKFFSKRKGNNYARSAHEAIKVNLNYQDMQKYVEKNVDKKALKKGIPTTHYEAINIEHLKDSPHKQYIEFRYLGSGDYHKRWNEIKRVTAHYIWALSAACDPTYKFDEYTKKLNRILLKHELFTLYVQKSIIIQTKKNIALLPVVEKQIKQLESLGIKVSKHEMDLFSRGADVESNDIIKGEEYDG